MIFYTERFIQYFLTFALTFFTLSLPLSRAGMEIGAAGILISFTLLIIFSRPRKLIEQMNSFRTMKYFYLAATIILLFISLAIFTTLLNFDFSDSWKLFRRKVDHLRIFLLFICLVLTFIIVGQNLRLLKYLLLSLFLLVLGLGLYFSIHHGMEFHRLVENKRLALSPHFPDFMPLKGFFHNSRIFADVFSGFFFLNLIFLIYFPARHYLRFLFIISLLLLGTIISFTGRPEFILFSHITCAIGLFFIYLTKKKMKILYLLLALALIFSLAITKKTPRYYQR